MEGSFLEQKRCLFKVIKGLDIKLSTFDECVHSELEREVLRGGIKKHWKRSLFSVITVPVITVVRSHLTWQNSCKVSRVHLVLRVSL